MSDGIWQLIIGAILLLHGFGHGGAVGALLWVRARPGTDTGGWTAAHSWAMPQLATSPATIVASAFWIVALVGFVMAALGFWGILVPDAWWPPIAVGSAIVSLAGIGLFVGTWPAFNTIAAVAVNVVVLVAVLLLDWPSATIAT